MGGCKVKQDSPERKAYLRRYYKDHKRKLLPTTDRMIKDIKRKAQIRRMGIGNKPIIRIHEDFYLYINMSDFRRK